MGAAEYGYVVSRQRQGARLLRRVLEQEVAHDEDAQALPRRVVKRAGHAGSLRDPAARPASARAIPVRGLQSLHHIGLVGARTSSSERVERAIESALEARTGRDCVFMPSGRFAIHLAFRLLLAPGDRILMSPLEDDTVFFGALAAGLRPVMAPVAREDGNIRVGAVSDATWSSLAAVLTGNTYGLPDRVPELVGVCAGRGIRLIEDAAHAIETDVAGRAVGSFGAASVFSLSKHFPGRGGVLALDRSLDRRHVIRERDRLMLHRPLKGRALAAGRTFARSALEAMRLWPTLDRARQGLRPVRPAPWRVPLRADALERAAASRDSALRQLDGDGLSGLSHAAAPEPPAAHACTPT